MSFERDIPKINQTTNPCTNLLELNTRYANQSFLLGGLEHKCKALIRDNDDQIIVVTNLDNYFNLSVCDFFYWIKCPFTSVEKKMFCKVDEVNFTSIEESLTII
ncbi:MAG: hypothetical protein ACRDBG_25965 [Waterburya sp.]